MYLYTVYEILLVSHNYKVLRRAEGLKVCRTEKCNQKKKLILTQ